MNRMNIGEEKEEGIEGEEEKGEEEGATAVQQQQQQQQCFFAEIPTRAFLVGDWLRRRSPSSLSLSFSLCVASGETQVRVSNSSTSGTALRDPSSSYVYILPTDKKPKAGAEKRECKKSEKNQEK